MKKEKNARYKKIPVAAIIPAVLILALYGNYFASLMVKANFIKIEIAASVSGIVAALFALWLIKRMPKWAANVVIALMTAYVVSFAVFAAAVMSYGVSSRSDAVIPDGKGEDVAVVVLGCRTYQTPGKMLRKRLDSAYEVLSALPESAGVMCGGQGPNEPRSEASAMAEYLVNKGVSAARLYLDESSANTEENIENMKAILESEPALAGRRLVVVTSDFHLLRARRLLMNAGFEEGSFVMRAGLPSDFFTTASNLVREYMSWAKVLILELAG